MSPAARESVEQVRKVVHEVLAGRTSDIFMGRIDGILEEWSAEKLTAAQACEKVRKVVALFIGEDLAKEIGSRCVPIVMRESSPKK
ncbi:MAG: hypothetical protein HGB21_06610 [Nitrospirae bacterium]|nr:hypothetical protein [Nitrospirota bacterium]NTW65968.1 hypothetical protein [Nitrospirota bacterium]